MEAKDTVMSEEQRKQIPVGFHYLLEYKEELDWLLQAQAEISFKAGIREVVEQGDALLNDAYWRGKFSIGEIRQFWNQLRERCGL